MARRVRRAVFLLAIRGKVVSAWLWRGCGVAVAWRSGYFLFPGRVLSTIVLALLEEVDRILFSAGYYPLLS